MYLGGYELEEAAAEAYDMAALKCKGRTCATNFPAERYADLLDSLDSMTLEELIMAVRRQSQVRRRNVYMISAGCVQALCPSCSVNNRHTCTVEQPAAVALTVNGVGGGMSISCKHSSRRVFHVAQATTEALRRTRQDGGRVGSASRAADMCTLGCSQMSKRPHGRTTQLSYG